MKVIVNDGMELYPCLDLDTNKDYIDYIENNHPEDEVLDVPCWLFRAVKLNTKIFCWAETKLKKRIDKIREKKSEK